MLLLHSNALKYALKTHRSINQNKHIFIIQFQIFCLYVEILLDLYGLSFIIVQMEENSSGAKIV